MTDSILVQEYARTRSPDLLAELVSRHTHWVYSAALRMVADPHLAEDVTQAVFLVLIRKAATLEGKAVDAWLFGVTRFAAKTALRTRARQQRHERLAAIMTDIAATQRNDPSWTEIAPLLDQMVDRLAGQDRRAVLLRFYQAKSMSEVGAALGVSEDAAKKRVARAVKRLRELLGARGIHMPADALAVVMLENAAHPAPLKLAATCVAQAAGAAPAAASIASGVIALMGMTKLKIAALLMMALALVPAVIVLVLQTSAPPANTPASIPAPAAQTTSSDPYTEAAASLTIDSPSMTAMPQAIFPAMAPEWRATEAVAWDADSKARELVRKARSLDAIELPLNDFAYCASITKLANHIGDSAIYANSVGNDAEAIEEIRDLLKMTHLLVHTPHPSLEAAQTSANILNLTMYRLELITAGVVLTADPKNTADLSVASARKLIAQLLDQSAPDAKSGGVATKWQGLGVAPSRVEETIRQLNAEETLAGMSLACHVFQFEQNRWPESLEGLIPAYLPRAMIDPYGDGKQTYGYALIKDGLQSGGDRPLVYSRRDSADGVFFVSSRPFYSAYIFSFRNTGSGQKTHGGQFRDVARWEPAPNYTGPTTRPLP